MNNSFPGGSLVKNLPASAEDAGSILDLGRSPGEGNGNPLQCSCWDNPMNRGAWWATGHGVAKVRHNFATKQPPLHMSVGMFEFLTICTFSYFKSGIASRTGLVFVTLFPEEMDWVVIGFRYRHYLLRLVCELARTC